MPSASPSSLTPVSDADMPLTPAPSPQVPGIAGESVIELQSALLHIQHQAFPLFCWLQTSLKLSITN